MSQTFSEASIGVMGLEELILHKRLVATDNAAGVTRVDKLALPGRYHRSPATALDVDPAETARAGLWLNRYHQLRQPYGFIRCLHLRDARVVGQGSVVTRDGLLLAESAAEALAHREVPAGLLPGAAGAGLALPPGASIVMDRETLVLQRPWWRDYRHWLLDSAASLALALRMAAAPPWQILVGRPDGLAMREIVSRTCALLAPGVRVAERVDREIWQAADLLWVTPPCSDAPFAHPEALAALRLLLSESMAAEPMQGRRLFVVQEPHPLRRLDNQAELIAIAASRGFEVVDAARLNLIAQVRLFRSARFVAGAAGPAMANLFMTPAGGGCLMLSPADWPDPGLWDLACHAGLSYREAFGRLTTQGRAPGLNDYVIDPARFAALLPD